MPQMAPMWWTLIFIFTNWSLMLMITLMFFNKNHKIILFKNLKLEKKNWKW